ncbi:MAG TPA: Uma2 family endonuclease [Gemmataceae bacterium]|nr:Uma2 family endonuclease [Gemmataceae bacterium]
MSAAIKLNLVSVEDYLAGELVSPIKHEYRAGVVYAMAGARIGHNRIAVNTIIVLGNRLRGQRCRPYNSDTKVRILLPTETRFYYPDVSVVCQSNASNESYQDQPIVIAEVLSESTRRIDEGEKKDGYLTIPSLGVYLLIEQDQALVTVHRRTDSGFVREVYVGLAAVIPLKEIKIELPLSEIYRDVEFTAESNTEDER